MFVISFAVDVSQSCLSLLFHWKEMESQTRDRQKEKQMSNIDRNT